MATWSLVPFFNELDILEIRLATLDPVVDYHVIGESRLTQSGKPKPLYFANNRRRFDGWKHKIRYLEIKLPEGPGPMNWAREKGQRRRLIDGFDGKPDDLILLSDVDEIPHPDAIDAVRKASVAGEAIRGDWILLCRMHVGKLNYRWKTPAHESHSVARIFPASLVGTRDLEDLRLTHMEPLGPPGWHLSWMQDMGTKLAAFAHQEMVPHARPDLALRGGPLFPGLVNQPLERCELAELPPYVAANRERFAHMIA